MKQYSRFFQIFIVFAIFSINLFPQKTENSKMLENGINFLDVPYVAHTLEINNDEQLVINVNEVDCTTFVEYTLALSLSMNKERKVNLEKFKDYLQKIRYRDGVINGYSSRLHYTTDWINNGIKMGFLRDITVSQSNYSTSVKVNYMTTHPESYKPLSQSVVEMGKMKEIESQLSRLAYNYLPKEFLRNKGFSWIKDGDIIAIVTNIPGLDIAHLGLAFNAGDKLYLLHASSIEKRVVVSDIPLAAMLNGNKNWIGIRVLRMIDPMNPYQ